MLLFNTCIILMMPEIDLLSLHHFATLKRTQDPVLCVKAVLLNVSEWKINMTRAFAHTSALVHRRNSQKWLQRNLLHILSNARSAFCLFQRICDSINQHSTQIQFSLLSTTPVYILLSHAMNQKQLLHNSFSYLPRSFIAIT